MTVVMRPRHAEMVAAECLRSGENITDVLHKAVLVLDFVLRAEREGKQLTLVDGEGNSERIVILT